MSKSFGTEQGKILHARRARDDPPEVQAAVADSGREVSHDPEAKPGISNLVELMTVATGETIT